MNIDDGILSSPVYFHSGNTCIGKAAVLAMNGIAEFQVFQHQCSITGRIVGVPMRFPVFDYAQPEPVRMCLVAHRLGLPSDFVYDYGNVAGTLGDSSDAAARPGSKTLD